MTQQLRAAWQAGRRQARAELRVYFLTPAFVATLAAPLVLVACVWFFLQNKTLDDSVVQLSAFGLAGCLGAIGLLGAFQLLSEQWAERNDGTLLRLRTLPDGVGGWVTGKTLSVGLFTVFTFVTVLVSSLLVVPSLVPASTVRLLALLATGVLSFFVFLPLGVIMGSYVRSTWGMLLTMLGCYLLLGLTGSVVPVTWLPSAAQWLAALTPCYWTSHLARWALLPEAAGQVELARRFQPLVTLGVLALWAIVGYLLAPRVLRRRIGRETAHSLAKIRSNISTRGYA